MEANKIIKILYNTQCVYLNGTENKKRLNDYDTRWCNKCILSDIEFMVGGGTIKRNLCFAIWHNHILESDHEIKIEILENRINENREDKDYVGRKKGKVTS